MIVSLLTGALLIVLGLIGAALAGVFRRGRICGPQRLPPNAPVLPILLMLIIGGGCWMGGQMAFFAVRAYQHAKATGGEHLTMEHISADDMAVVATVPSLVALLVILAGDTRLGLVRALGLRVATLPRMFVLGLAAGVMALLLTYGSSSVLGVFYELVHYEHPSEHELLGAMKEASSSAKMLLVFGACVMAPLFEEVLFRGHLQTMLARLFTRRGAAPPAPPLAAVVAPDGWIPRQDIATEEATPVNESALAPVSAPALAPEVMPIPPIAEYATPVDARMRDSAAMRWVAIIITSLVFAVIHPLWTAPLIFLLSVCLGYAYERTGSLWVPIVMHAMFNTSSTLMFLLFM
jgi:membrane protease YdiL (CAAX protease family)